MALGIQETKELVAFGLSLGNAIADAFEDEKIDFGDILDFIPVLQKVGAALDGIADIPAELSDMSEVEYQELVAYVKEEFDIEDDKIEEYIEGAFAVAVKVAQFVMSFFKREEPV